MIGAREKQSKNKEWMIAMIKVKVLPVIIGNEGARVKVKVLKVIVGKGWVQQCPQIWVREWLGPKVDKR